MDLEAFELVLLRRPAGAPDYPGEELERIQREHLAYHARLREAGQVVTNGPVDGQPDPSLRGLAFYRTGSLERSRQLAEADPAVRAGRRSSTSSNASRSTHHYQHRAAGARLGPVPVTPSAHSPAGYATGSPTRRGLISVCATLMVPPRSAGPAVDGSSFSVSCAAVMGVRGNHAAGARGN